MKILPRVLSIYGNKVDKTFPQVSHLASTLVNIAANGLKHVQR